MTHPLIIAGLAAGLAIEADASDEIVFGGLVAATCAEGEDQSEAAPIEVTVEQIAAMVREEMDAGSHHPALQCQSVIVKGEFVPFERKAHYVGEVRGNDEGEYAPTVWIEAALSLDIEMLEAGPVEVTGRFYWLCAWAEPGEFLSRCDTLSVAGLVVENANILRLDNASGDDQ